MVSAVKLYSLEYRNARTWLFALLFVAGNMVVPQLFHLMPQGGVKWLPVYFFTLVAAYKYGWRVGLLTAVVSPLANSMCFGMPPAPALPAILLKSGLLAIFAGIAARRFRKASLWILAGVVLAYQTVGTLGEWCMKGDFWLAAQDFRLGLPGMCLQVFGGWLFINRIIRK